MQRAGKRFTDTITYIDKDGNMVTKYLKNGKLVTDIVKKGEYAVDSNGIITITQNKDVDKTVGGGKRELSTACLMGSKKITISKEGKVISTKKIISIKRKPTGEITDPKPIKEVK